MKIITENGQKRFTIMAAVWGMLFLFLILPWQGPDEYAHVGMIGYALGVSELPDFLHADLDLDEHRIRWNPDGREGGSIELGQVLAAMHQKPGYDRKDCLPRAISIRIISHLPAAVGMEIGILLGLPTYWVMTLGKFCALMTYIFCGNIALKLMPVRKEILELTMLMPMCIQQAASLNYDGVLLPASFLLIAFLFYLKYEADQVGLREVLAVLLLLSCIAIVKLPYVMMGGLVFLIPVRKISISLGRIKVTGDMLYKARWIICLLCVAVIASIVYVGRNNMWIGIVCGSVANPIATIRLLGRTWLVWSEDLVLSFVGNFGWMDAPVAIWFAAAAIALFIVMAMTKITGFDDSPQYALTVRDRVIVCLVCAICIYLIAMSMVAFTVDYHSDDWGRSIRETLAISGMQGRYFIPLAPLVMVVMPHLFEMKENIYKKLITVWYVFACLYTSGVVAWRYWKL